MNLQHLRPPIVKLTYEENIDTYDEDSIEALVLKRMEQFLARRKLEAFIEKSFSNFPVFGTLISVQKNKLRLGIWARLIRKNPLYLHLFPEVKNKEVIAKNKELVALENLILLITLKAFRKAIVVPINNTFNKILSIYLPIIFIVIRIFSIQKNLSISA